MQKTAEQDKSDVQDKFVMANATEVSYNSRITRAFESSTQLNQIYNNSKRAKIYREMERSNRTPLT